MTKPTRVRASADSFFLFGAKKKIPDRRLSGKEKIDLPGVKNSGNRKLVL